MDERFRNLLKRISTFKRLPTLPHVLIRLIEVCNDENISLQELSRILAVDPGLTARVLYLANSSYYRNKERITHIDQALLRMGRNTVKNLVLSAAVHEVFNRDNGHNAVQLKKFWRHSLLCAVLARTIAIKTGFREPEQAFFAGMIHDVGKLVLSANFPEEYGRIADLDEKNPQYLLDEETAIGAPHTQIGAWLLNNWNLDSFTVDAVLYHHEAAPRIANAFPLVRIVYTANLLAGMTDSGEARCEDAMKFLSLSIDEMTDLVIRAEEETEMLAQSFGIDIGPQSGFLGGNGDDESKQRELMDDVGDMAMLFGVLQDLTEAVAEEDMLAAIHEGVRTLFDNPEAMLFLYDSGRDILINHGDPYSDRLTIPLDGSTNLPARSLTERVVVTSASLPGGSVSIMDEQLARHMGKKALIAAPLIARTENVGVLVIGLDEADAKDGNGQVRLLKLFANTAAMALHAERTRKEYERRVQSERLAAVNALMRRVAHEINNPLGIIKNFLLILATKLGESNDVQKEIQVIREEIDRIIRILPELSDTEKAKERLKIPVDLNALISDMAGMIDKSVAKQRGIVIQVTLQPDLPPLKADRDGIKQILINLLKNAIEALPQGGHIFIETVCLPVGESGDSADTPASSPREIRIVIRDDGPGIAESVRNKLFEPCISTKGEGHSGIGLSVVYRIMKDHGGNIDCESLPGKGTTFTLMFPVTT